MLAKTRGIILSQIKYSDTSLVVRVYTRDYGRISALIRGAGSKKGGKHKAFFQPLSILDIDLNYKTTHEMQNLKEFSLSYVPNDIYQDVKKGCVAIFLGEVLTSVLKEESSNEEMFDYIENSIIYFDKSKEGFANFHIAFLAGLTSYLGFEPALRNSVSDKFFDMTNGEFHQVPPFNGNYSNETISAKLAEFFESSYENSGEIVMTGSLRNEVLESILKYFSLHLSGLKKIRSLEVLKEVFS